MDDAIRSYELYLKLAPDAEDHDSVARLVESLRVRRERSRPELLVTTSPDGAQVFLDGAEASSGVTPLKVRVAPGTHAVRVVRDGYAAALRSVTVTPGQQNALVVELKAAEAAAPSPEVAGGAAPSPGWRPVVAWSAVGLGVAAAGLGVWAHLDATSKQDEGAALGKGRQDEADALNADIERDGVLAAVGYGAGVALLATGVTLLLLPEGDGTVALGVSPQGVSLGGLW